MASSNDHIQPISKKVLFLTKYDPSGASSRYRTYQYLPHLTPLQYTVAPLLTQQYLQQRFKHDMLGRNTLASFPL